jgi:hypothetical protein
VVAWVHALHRREPELTGREVAERMAEELSIEIHRRSIERLLGAARKKNA